MPSPRRRDGQRRQAAGGRAAAQGTRQRWAAPAQAGAGAGSARRRPVGPCRQTHAGGCEGARGARWAAEWYNTVLASAADGHSRRSVVIETAVSDTPKCYLAAQRRGALDAAVARLVSSRLVRAPGRSSGLAAEGRSHDQAGGDTALCAPAPAAPSARCAAAAAAASPAAAVLRGAAFAGCMHTPLFQAGSSA